MTAPHLLLACALALILAGCADEDERWEKLSPRHPLNGQVLRFHYPDSPTGGDVTGEFVGSMLVSPLFPVSPGTNSAHVPVFDIRLDDGSIVHVRDADAPPLARGSRVVLMPSAHGYSLMPAIRR